MREGGDCWWMFVWVCVFFFFNNQFEHVIYMVFTVFWLVVSRKKEWSLNIADIDICFHTIVCG